jgi:hypothetical protein
MVVQLCGCEVVKSIVCAQGVSWRVCVAVSTQEVGPFSRELVRSEGHVHGPITVSLSE